MMKSKKGYIMEKTKKFLKNFIKNDSDFLQLYSKNKKQLKKKNISFNYIINMVLNDVIENFENYLLDKKYIDFSYIVYNENIINLDYIYTYFKLIINELQN